MDTKAIDNNSMQNSLHDLSLKARAAILFILNLLVIGPFMIQHFQFGYVGVSLAILAVTFYITVGKTNENLEKASCGILPFLMFADILIVILSAYEQLGLHFGGAAPNINWDIATLPFSLLLIVGGVLCLVSFSKLETRLWLFTLGALLIGFAFTVVVWHTLNFDDFRFKQKGEIYFMLYCSFAVVWFFFCSVSGFCNPNRGAKVCLMNVCIVVMTYIMNFQELTFLKEMSDDLSVMFFELADTGFPWWKIVLAFLVLGGCAIAMEDNDKNFIGSDCYTMLSMAALTMIFKLYIEHYFYLNWLVLILSMAVFLIGLKNQSQRKLVFGYSELSYILGVFFASMAAIFWLDEGYWISVLLWAVFGFIAHRIHSLDFLYQNKPWTWIFLFIFVAANTIALLLVDCYLLETIILIALMLVAACIVIYVLNYPHPNGHTASESLKLFILFLLCIGCALPIVGAGSDIETKADAVENRVMIQLEANGRNNDVKLAYCYWSGDDGERLGDIIYIEGGDADIRVRSNKLTIVTKDTKDRITTKTEWFTDRYLSN